MECDSGKHLHCQQNAVTCGGRTIEVGGGEMFPYPEVISTTAPFPQQDAVVAILAPPHQ